ncbi:phage protease [Thaumasiovibrio subtropicus]|uniref:phage protease n=1 Tax=Thaumasiovibrio subtropicus TaxID=1891207 RepID=UPI000B356EC9|nr:phage protease [Thaumasiovibrio subtropicus]
MNKITASSHPINYAVLSAENPHPFAVLSAELTPAEDGWVQLLPAGPFTARDGRPHDTADGHWHLDANSANAFITATQNLTQKVLVDYDHQALTARESNGPVPAAAWLSTVDIEWREPDEKQSGGIFIKPEWTSTARQLIDNKEYAFLSAVFPYDKTGRPLYLRMAALTNDPAVLGMEPLAQLAADFNVNLTTPNTAINLHGTTEDSLMNDLLKQLLGKLGIELPDNANPSITTEQAAAALSALDALQTKAEESESLATQVTDLNSQIASLSCAYNGVTEQIAALSVESTTGQVLGILSEAKAAGKIVAAEEDYLTTFGKQHGIAALSAMLDKRPAITALTTQQTATHLDQQQNQQQDPQLTDEDLAVLSACGLDKSTFLEHKE